MRLDMLEASDCFTSVTPTHWSGKIIQFPLVRIVIALLFLSPASLIYRAVANRLNALAPESLADLAELAGSLLGIALFLAAYWLYLYLIERRRAFELSPGAFPKEFFQGLTLAVILIGSTLALIAILGSISASSTDESGWILLLGFSHFTLPALFEEILFRLILFRLTEEWLGSWPAIAIQAIFFGSAHLGNPNATIWSSVSIVLSAGLLLAALYIYTRRLWLVWGVHLGWNYLQASVLSLPVSGRADEGLWHWELTGPEWLTGGEFGIEASVLTVAVCVIVSGIVFKRCATLGRFVLPSWKRVIRPALIAPDPPPPETA